MAYNTVSDQGEERKRWATNFQLCLRSIRGHCCNGWCNMDKSGNTVKNDSSIVSIFGACWWCLRNSHWDFVSINYVEMIRIKNCDIVQIYSQKKKYIVRYGAEEGTIRKWWAVPKVLRKYWKCAFQEFYLKMEKLQTLLRLSFLLVANIEVCPQGGSCLCRWCSKCRPESLAHIVEWQNQNCHLTSNSLFVRPGPRVWECWQWSKVSVFVMQLGA